MTGLINNFIDFVLELVMFLFPDIAFVSDFLVNIGTYMSIGIDLLKKVNFLIPVPLIFRIIIIQLTLKIAYVALFIVNWVIKRIFDVIP